MLLLFTVLFFTICVFFFAFDVVTKNRSKRHIITVKQPTIVTKRKTHGSPRRQ